MKKKTVLPNHEYCYKTKENNNTNVLNVLQNFQFLEKNNFGES